MAIIKYTPKNTPTKTKGEATINIYRDESFVLSRKATQMLGIQPEDRISVFEQIIPGVPARREWYITTDADGFRVYMRESRPSARFNSRALADDILDKCKLTGRGYKFDLATVPEDIEGYTAYCILISTAKVL